jgi:uncharacterized protein DUF6438
MERLALVLLAACWTGSDARTAAPGPVAPREGPPLEISLERTPCFGTCPVYKLAIRDDGRVDWLGREHVAQVGARTRRIARADLDALDRDLEAARFFDRDLFGRVPQEPSCVTQGSTRSCTFTSDTICSDTSITILIVRRGRQLQRVHNEHCSDADPALDELERRILERAGAAAWIGR